MHPSRGNRGRSGPRASGNEPGPYRARHADDCGPQERREQQPENFDQQKSNSPGVEASRPAAGVNPDDHPKGVDRCVGQGKSPEEGSDSTRPTAKPARRDDARDQRKRRYRNNGPCKRIKLRVGRPRPRPERNAKPRIHRQRRQHGVSLYQITGIAARVFPCPIRPIGLPYWAVGRVGWPSSNQERS